MSVNFFALSITFFVLFAFSGHSEDFLKGAQRIGPSANEPQLQQYRLSSGRIVEFGTDIIVKAENEGVIMSLIERYTPVKHEILSETMCLMTFPANTDVTTLSENISTQKGVVLAHPNLRSPKRMR